MCPLIFIPGRGNWASVGGKRVGSRTLLNCLAGHLQPDAGAVALDTALRAARYCHDERARTAACCSRTVTGHSSFNMRRRLRMNVSAGGNVGERAVAVNAAPLRRHPRTKHRLAGRVEISAGPDRRRPTAFFRAGLQHGFRSRAILVTGLVWLLWIEPDWRLDVRYRRGLLDLCCAGGREMGLSASFVTHGLVVRLLADRLMVMKRPMSRERPDRIRCSTIRACVMTRSCFSVSGMSHRWITGRKRVESFCAATIQGLLNLCMAGASFSSRQRGM